MPFHHVAYVTRDVEATTHFYEDLMGFPLVYTEVQSFAPEVWMRHIFFDTGEDNYMAFFQFEGVGEKPDYHTDVSEGVGLPVWVNHASFKSDEAGMEALRARMAAEGIEPLMEEDHGWCHSLYYTDPNGIMVEFCRDTPGFKPDPAEAHRLLTVPPAEVAAERVR